MLIMGMFGTPAARCGPYSGQRLNEGSAWGPGYRRGEDDRKRLVVDDEAAELSGLVRTLRDYSPEDATRQIPKMQNRLYLRTKKSSVVLRNGLISLLPDLPRCQHAFWQPAQAFQRTFQVGGLAPAFCTSARPPPYNGLETCRRSNGGSGGIL